MRKMSRFPTLVAVLAVSVMQSACASSPAATTPSPQPAAQPASTATTAAAVTRPTGVTQAMVQTGRGLYSGAAECSNCHGQDGKGTGLGPNLTDRVWLNGDGSYDAIVRVITEGVPNPKEHSQPMQPKGGADITAEQVRALAAYVYTLSPRGTDAR
jgi:mono/diheme cytochrome c family protein